MAARPDAIGGNYSGAAGDGGAGTYLELDMKTTLNAIRAKSPCSFGWKKLLENLGKTVADDDPLALTTILESNGLDYALWCLRAVEGHDREMRLFAVECARSVQHLMTDKRSLNAIDMAERFANGLATQDELAAARAAAWAAAEAAAGAAARDAARDAEESAQAVLFILMCEGAL